MFLGFEHVGMPVEDPKALADWYADLFDAKVLQPVPDGAFFVKISNGIMFEIFKAPPAPADAPKAPPKLHLAFNVSDLAADRQYLIDKGVNYNEKTLNGPSFFFTDPAGNLLHLVQRDQAPVE